MPERVKEWRTVVTKCTLCFAKIKAKRLISFPIFYFRLQPQKNERIYQNSTVLSKNHFLVQL